MFTRDILNRNSRDFRFAKHTLQNVVYVRCLTITVLIPNYYQILEYWIVFDKKKKNEEYWTARYLGTWHAALVSAIRILMGHRWRGMSQIEKDEFTF